MSEFTIALIEHGYPDTDLERDWIESQGGRLLDFDKVPVEEALRSCHDADGVLVRRLELDRSLLEAHFRNVKVIVRYGVGVDNIDLEAATDLGVIVSRVPDYALEEVSDHAISLALGLARGVVERQRVMAGGGWDVRRETPLYRIRDQTIGLLSFGRIARRTASKLRAWNASLIACDPYIEQEIIRDAGVSPVNFDTLLSASDILLLHAPMLPENYHLIDDSALGKMKSGAYLVNTGRGPVVDTRALMRALNSGKLAGAALDVFEEEPLPPEDPLRSTPNLVLTDHMAWYSEQSQRQLQLEAAQEVVRGAKGELPRTIANPEVLTRLGREAEWPGDAASAWMARRRELLSRQ
jgi:D-3-phosphoglycerate dehydrogenase